MDSSTSASPVIKKQEDDDKTEKRDIKPVPKTLNRVPRACNACRKQKMRCEGADNPPCRRCRNTGLECLFEKPSREATLTGEAGLERIRSLEAHVADIRQTQTTISNSLAEIAHHLRISGFQARSPSAYPSSSFQQSPSLNSPAISTPTVSHQHASPPSGTPSFTSSSHVSGSTLPPRPQRTSLPNAGHQGSSSTQPSQALSSESVHQALSSPMFGNFSSTGQNFNNHSIPSQSSVLPPFSSIQTMGPPGQSNVSSVRYQSSEASFPKLPGSYSSKRPAPPTSSNVTSADSSDVDDEEGGELPASGLLAPWEVLRGLATVAVDRTKDNGDSSEPQSRTRTPSPERHSRPSKKRKLRHKVSQGLIFQDVITKNIVTEDDARELFKIFYDGCSTFLPVFDSNVDTLESLRERSPFAVDAICLVAARVRDGGNKPSEVHRRCLEEVQSISSATLFAPVVRNEAVQAMILVSGWSDNGWLSGGHAVRMAMELSMHQAWPKLVKRMDKWVSHGANADQELVVAARTWFCLYLFEHQLSYGTGRPAVLKDDESIRDCRLILTHPLSIEDDMRLVSTVELIAIRERVHNALAPFEGPVRPEHFDELHRAKNDFEHWYQMWDQAFSRKYEDAAFYRQSLQIQQFHAELFHNATALRGINGPDDVQSMHPSQRALAIRSIKIARRILEITVQSPAYRKGMTYAVHYTHATATFAASFLLRLARLFPSDCDIKDICHQVELLANLMNEIPGKRYALTLQLMLKRSLRRNKANSRSPKVTREPQRSLAMTIEQLPSHPTSLPIAQHGNVESFSPVYEMANYVVQESQSHAVHIAMNSMPNSMPQHFPHPLPNANEAETIWRGLEHNPGEQVPVWISDSNLGTSAFSQHGLDSFIMPTEFLPAPAAPPIW